MKKKNKKRYKKIYITIFSIILISFGLFYTDIFVVKRNFNINSITVEKGDGFLNVYKKLGLSYTVLDKIYFKLNNQNLVTGNYEIKNNITKKELFELLKSTDTQNIVLTIPEGFTQNQIFERIESLGLANKEDMLRALNKVDFPYYHEKDNFDGYLYPETYFIPKNAGADFIAKTILGEFLKKFPSEKYPDKKKFYEDLKLASVVMFETGGDDREKVAGVFKHRLRINMLLQSDATLKYDLGRMAYKKELQNNESLYNTYKHKGLPPTPICNPDKDTIEITINAPESEYLFFFMSGGKTYYSKTHEEHLRKRNEVK